MIFVNFKTYAEGSGQNATNLAKLVEEISGTTSVKLIPIVQSLDLKEVSSKVNVPVWLQHCDPIEYGAHTGWILPIEAKSHGAVGVVLNHSEHKIADWEILKKTHELARNAGLLTLIFAADIAELTKVLTLKPDFVSYEPPELVGNTEVSVSSAKPEIIKEAADLSSQSNIPLIVGAGIHSTEDVSTAIGLGAKGIAVATDVVKSSDSKSSLLKLLKGFE